MAGAATFGRLCVETKFGSTLKVEVVCSHLRAAVC